MDLNSKLNEMKKKASQLFKRSPESFEGFFSPARINLIGEHIDYNGGVCLPLSIDMGTLAVAAKNDHELVRCYSENFEGDGIIEFEIDNFEMSERGSWVNFVKGILKEFGDDGNSFQYGFDIYIKGEIPNGAGLSSSASLELLLGVIIRKFYFLDYNNFELALTGQKVEHHYIGVNCGLMDQFIIAKGLTNHAVLLNCKNQKYQYIPVDFKNYKLVITYSNYRRTLQDSKYNQRRSECEKALNIINESSAKKYDFLCDITKEEFETFIPLLDEVSYKRAKHCIDEYNRVIDASKYLQEKDIESFAKCLNGSDNSLKELYEVTGPHLDFLTNCYRQNGAIASRMTGAGFGGCIISLVESSIVDEVVDKVTKMYKEEMKLDAINFICNSSDCAKWIN